jgi:hypothetical protein
MADKTEEGENKAKQYVEESAVLERPEYFRIRSCFFCLVHFV